MAHKSLFKENNKDAEKYDPKFIGYVDKYLKKNRDRNVKILKQKNTDKGYEMFETRLKVKLPTIVGFALYLGVVEKTLHNWANEYPEFRVALDKIKSEQRQRLINSGLSGEYNSTIAKLILSSNHGMRERVDATTDDGPINNFNDEQVNRIADRIARRKSDDGNQSGEEASD